MPALSWPSRSCHGKVRKADLMVTRRKRPLDAARDPVAGPRELDAGPNTRTNPHALQGGS